jgi:tagaturonate reductase
MVEQLNRNTVTGLATYPERIVQIGGGNFMRAFVDWTVQILNDETDFNGQAVLVKARPGHYARIAEQDGLFHTVLRGIQDGELVEDYKLVSAISRTMSPYEDFDAFLDLACQPEIRFVFSNTTEAGIEYVESDQATDTPPSSFPAKLAIFLYARYQHFAGAVDKGCIVIPVELIEDNGQRLKEIILQYATLWGLDAGFAQWIEDHNLFCNTLVDRIVTGYPHDDAPSIHEKLGYKDTLLAAGEIYHSWIIEAPQSLLDEFPVNEATTPLNIKVVDDAQPYRTVKVRVLNGAHTSMVPIGFLLGFESVRESVEHPVLGQFIENLIAKEIVPSVDGANQDDLEAFAGAVLDRFRNPHIHHLLLSIALNTSSKLKFRVLPSLKAYHEKTGELPQRLMIAVAAFIRFYKGEWQGEAIPLNDDADRLVWFKQTWDTSESVQDVVRAVMSNLDFWDEDFTQIDGLVDGLTDIVEAIDAGNLLDVLRKANG